MAGGIVKRSAEVRLCDAQPVVRAAAVSVLDAAQLDEQTEAAVRWGASWIDCRPREQLGTERWALLPRMLNQQQPWREVHPSGMTVTESNLARPETESDCSRDRPGRAAKLLQGGPCQS